MPPSDVWTDCSIVPRAVVRAWSWRRRIDAGEFATIQKLADAVGLAGRHAGRQLRLAFLAPEVMKHLTCGREAPTISLHDLCFLVGKAGAEQVR